MDGARPAGAVASLDLKSTVDRLCVGGWPGFLSASPIDAQYLLRSYLDDVARSDIVSSAPEAPRRDPGRVRRLLMSYGRHVSTPASFATLAADTATAAETPVKAETVAAYIQALSRTMVIEEQPAWGPHLRSRAVVRQGAVRHFVDPSLAVAALSAGPERLLHDPNTLGLLFESMVIRDLRVYAQAIDGDVLHYRDSNGQEADAIVQLRDGRWAAVEVKLGASGVDHAAKSLLSLVNTLDVRRTGAPSALLVITASQYAYTREDGVMVAPLSCLAP